MKKYNKILENRLKSVTGVAGSCQELCVYVQRKVGLSVQVQRES